MQKPHRSPEAPYRKREYVAMGICIMAPVIAGVAGCGVAQAAPKTTIHDRLVRADHRLLREETQVWKVNLGDSNPTKFTTHTSTRDGRHFRSTFRVYSGRPGHRHLLLRLKLRAVIMPAVIEEEEFLFEDGTGWVYYDSGHSLKVWSTNR